MNGTLVLPKNCVAVSQEEMEYINGGIDWDKVRDGALWVAGAAVAVGATILAVATAPVTVPAVALGTVLVMAGAGASWAIGVGTMADGFTGCFTGDS